MIIGRMRVEPGSTPVWEGGDKGGYRRGLLSRMLNQGMRMGRNYLGDRPINMPEYAEEEIKGDIRKNIEDYSYLSDPEKNEVFEKLNEIVELQKSKESKTKKWDRAKQILAFLLDKGADLAIMYIPQILAAITK